MATSEKSEINFTANFEEIIYKDEFERDDDSTSLRTFDLNKLPDGWFVETAKAARLSRHIRLRDMVFFFTENANNDDSLLRLWEIYDINSDKAEMPPNITEELNKTRLIVWWCVLSRMTASSHYFKKLESINALALYHNEDGKFIEGRPEEKKEDKYFFYDDSYFVNLSEVKAEFRKIEEIYKIKFQLPELLFPIEKDEGKFYEAQSETKMSLYNDDECDLHLNSEEKTKEPVTENRASSKSDLNYLSPETIDLIVKSGREAQSLYNSMKSLSTGPGFADTGRSGAESRKECAICKYDENPEDFKIIQREMLDELETYMCDNQNSTHSGRYIIGRFIQKSLSQSDTPIGSYQKCFELFKKNSKKEPA